MILVIICRIKRVKEVIMKISVSKIEITGCIDLNAQVIARRVGVVDGARR